MHKANRSAKCHARCSEAIISVGTLWLKVKYSVTVPLNRNDALQQDFCFCSQKFCLSSMPLWSNLRYLNSADADAGIADIDKGNVVKDLQALQLYKLPNFHNFEIFIFLTESLQSLFLLPLSLRNFLQKLFLLNFEKVVFG